MTLRALLSDPACRWSVGTGAAVAGFTPSGRVQEEDGGLVAENGAARLRLTGVPQLLAFETLSSDPFGWNHGLALCVPGGAAPPQVPGLALAGDAVVRLSFRPDADSDRGPDPAPDPADEAAARVLPGTWTLATAIARLDLWQAGGAPPVHRPGTPPPATTPLPAGWQAAAHAFPAPACRGGFDPARHAAFQTLLARHGRPDLLALKAQVQALLAEGRFAALPPAGRHGRAVIRIALRQAVAQGRIPPEAWLRAHDRALFAALGGVGN